MEKKNIKLKLNNGILDMQKSDDLFMYTEFVIVSDCPNLNNYHFNSEFIDSIVNSQEKYIGSPLVVDIDTLLGYDFESLGHRYSTRTGLFNTVEIGSFYSFEKRLNSEGIYELIGYAKISKRNEDLCEAITELFNSDIGLNVSVEVVACEYSVVDDTLIIGASESNYMSGVAIVSFPANPNSKVLTLVAQYLSKENDDMKNNIFSELKHDDIKCQLSDLINIEKDEYGYRKWNYWLSAVYNDYAIYCDYNTAGVYYKIEYTVSSENVVSLTGLPVKVEINYKTLSSKGGKNVENIKLDVNQLVAEKDALAVEKETLKNELESTKETVATLKAEKEALVSEKAEIETKLNEANETVVTLGKDKEILAEKVESFTSAETERVEKESVEKIEAMIKEVESDLTGEELTMVNELAEKKDVKAVEFKLNEIIANHYKETLRLNNESEGSFFAIPKNKNLGTDELSKFNM